jgi:glucosamine-6-phosphate deaminase
MQLELFNTHEELSQRACEAVVDVIKRNVRTRGRATLLVPTGETPRRLYALLAAEGNRGTVDFSKVILFAIDEYFGGRDFRDYLETQLVSLLPPSNRPVLHVLNGLATDWSGEAAAHEKKMEAAGGIDLCLLGVGVEGHLGFNEVGASPDSRTRLVDLAPSTIKANQPSMKGRYTQALTVGLGTIVQSRTIFVLASGEKKARPIALVFSDKPAPGLPLAVLRTHPDTTFFLDRTAASGIDASHRPDR